MAVFTAAIAAITAAIAAPALATVGAAAIAVGTAVGTAGLGLSVVGMVTGNKKLQKIGGYMGMAGGITSLAGGIIGGKAAVGLYGKHLGTAWDDGVGQFFSDGPAVANGPALGDGGTVANTQAGTAPAPTGDGGGIIGGTSPSPKNVPGVRAGQLGVEQYRSPGAALPGRMSPHTAAAAKGTGTGSWWDDLATSDKIAAGLAVGRAGAGLVEGAMTAGQLEDQNKIEREKLHHGGPNPAPPKIRLSTVRKRRESGG